MAHGLLDASSCVKTVGSWRGLVACWKLSFPIGVSKNFTYINTSAFNAVFWVRHSLQSPGAGGKHRYQHLLIALDAPSGYIECTI